MSPKYWQYLEWTQGRFVRWATQISLETVRLTETLLLTGCIRSRPILLLLSRASCDWANLTANRASNWPAAVPCGSPPSRVDPSSLSSRANSTAKLYRKLSPPSSKKQPTGWARRQYSGRDILSPKKLFKGGLNNAAPSNPWTVTGCAAGWPASQQPCANREPWTPLWSWLCGMDGFITCECEQAVWSTCRMHSIIRGKGKLHQNDIVADLYFRHLCGLDKSLLQHLCLQSLKGRVKFARPRHSLLRPFGQDYEAGFHGIHIKYFREWSGQETRSLQASFLRAIQRITCVTFTPKWAAISDTGTFPSVAARVTCSLKCRV